MAINLQRVLNKCHYILLNYSPASQLPVNSAQFLNVTTLFRSSNGFTASSDAAGLPVIIIVSLTSIYGSS